MSDIKNNFVHWAFQRKAELTDHVFSLTGGRVHRGPFQGMLIAREYRPSDNPAGKLLGLYESEIHPAINQVINSNPDVILNVGSGEGFYGIGLSMRTHAPAILVDTDATSFPMAQHNAELNDVADVTCTDSSTVENFQNLIGHYRQPHVFMDCEGFEDQLLDPVAFPALAKSSIIVESHDCFRPGITPKLIDRFIATHQIQVINQGAKNPYQDILYDLDDFDKMLLCVECRPSTATWLFMTPDPAKNINDNSRNSYFVK
jgi:hypothetical protein